MGYPNLVILKVPIRSYSLGHLNKPQQIIFKTAIVWKALLAFGVIGDWNFYLAFFIWIKLLSINYLIEATINFAQMQYPQPEYPQPDKSNRKN